MLPAYTYSLDAALTLVPERCEVRLTMHTDPAFIARASVQRHVVDVTMPSHRGRTPALALCIAVLKARMPGEALLTHGDVAHG